jgi:hypothetical protein
LLHWKRQHHHRPGQEQQDTRKHSPVTQIITS